MSCSASRLTPVEGDVLARSRAARADARPPASSPRDPQGLRLAVGAIGTTGSVCTTGSAPTLSLPTWTLSLAGVAAPERARSEPASRPGRPTGTIPPAHSPARVMGYSRPRTMNGRDLDAPPVAGSSRRRPDAPASPGAAHDASRPRRRARTRRPTSTRRKRRALEFRAEHARSLRRLARAIDAARELAAIDAAACRCARRGVCSKCRASLKYSRDARRLGELARVLVFVGRVLEALGRRAPKIDRPTCGARCRDGHACRARVVVRDLAGAPGGDVRTRCRLHGGESTGPRTADGKRRALDALARGRATLAARREKNGR